MWLTRINNNNYYQYGGLGKLLTVDFPRGALESCISPHIIHHHVISSEPRRPMAELAADEGAELHRSELQHLKVKLETWNRQWSPD